jgi:hypothetical protein
MFQKPSIGEAHADIDVAMNSCVGDPNCGGVYQPGCTELELHVEVIDQFSLDKLAASLERREKSSGDFGEKQIYYEVRETEI